MQMLFHKKQRTPLGFCDGLHSTFVGFGSKDERGCRPPKYHASYAPYYPIHKAASTGDVATVKNFIERGVFAMEQTDWKYRTALHFACVYGHPEVVTLLVESSCEISPKDIKDATPLIKASQCRQTECLDILLKHGADPNIMDCSENTALHYAVYNGDIKTATKLLEYKANIEAINENKITPLLLALKQNKEKMAEFLINNGANEKTCDFLGRSSLMYAVRCGSELIIKLLLQRDIDTFKQDVFGWTAKRYAVESKSKVRKLLIDYDEEELRQRCTETIRRDACITPILPTREVKDSPQSEALEKTEARPSKSETMEEDTCIMPILLTTEVRDSPQSDKEDDIDIVEKAEARPSKSENTKTDACSMPTTTEVEDFHQDVAAEEAEANPSQSEPGLGVSPEEKGKTSDHNENNWSLDSGNSGDEEENSKDISKGRVLAWVEKDDSLKPTTTEKKSSSDDIEIIMLKPFNSDLSVEEVIEVSSEEEQKGGEEEEDDDGDDEDGDDGDDEGGDDEGGNDEDGDDEDGGDDEGGTGQAQLVVEEMKQSAGRSNQEDPSSKQMNNDSVTYANGRTNSSNNDKLSSFHEDEDFTEDSKGAATEQPLGKDENPKSQRDEESDETTEEEETKPPLGQDKTSIPQTDEDSTEDSEEEARKQPVEKCNQENYCQKTNNDKNFAQIFEDSSMDSEEEAPEQPVGKRSQRSPYKMSILQKLEDSRDDSERVFECLSKKGIDHLHVAADQSGDKHIKESPKKYPLFKPTIEMSDLDPKTALGMADVQTLTSANSDSEVTSTENEKSHSDSTINSPLTIFKYIPRKEENGYLAVSSHLQGQNTATGQMKEPAADLTSREEKESDNGRECTQASSISETYGLKKILGYLQRIPDQQTQTMATGRTAGVKGTTSREEQSQSESSMSDHSWTFSAPLPQRVDMSPLTRSRDHPGENMAREKSKGNEVTPIENLRRHESHESVESLSSWSVSEHPPLEQDVGHLSETADPGRENTRNGEMKVFSDFSKESPTQLKLSFKRKSSFLKRAVAKRQERPWESEPDKELTLTEEQRNHALRGRSESLQKEDVQHLTGAGDQRRESQTRYTIGVLCKEVTIKKRHRRHKSQKSFQPLVTRKPNPLNEDIVCCTGIAGQERENVVNAEMKAVSSTEVKFTEEHKTENSVESTESMKIDVSHLPGTANQRRKTITSGEMKEESRNEERAVEELKRHGSHQSLQSWTTSETFSLDDVVHLARTMDERPETTTNTEVKAKPHRGVLTPAKEQRRQESMEKLGTRATSECLPQRNNVDHLATSEHQGKENMTNDEKEATKKEMASTEEPRRNSGKEKVTPLIVSSLPSTREHLGHLATTVHQRRENNTSLEMNGPCNEEISTENDQNCDSHESVRSLSISEALAQEDVVHLPKTADQRGEHVASGQMKGKPSLYVTCRDPNGENGSKNNQPLLKHKRKTRLSNKMDIVEKPSYGNTTAAAGGDGDNAAAISDTAVRNGFIQQMHCGKASNHQFPVTQKKHVRLTKKTSSEKNKALKYTDAMDDHQLSESLSEDCDLPDYDNILMLVDQLQMNYKDSGKPLEIQDAVHSYKMILERNQNHSELLIAKSKNKRNQGHRVMKKPRETEKAKLQLRCRREEQQLDLLDVGSPEKQDVQQRNPDGWYEEMKKELTEKDQQHEREKQQLELRLRAQDMELQHLRNDINKLQEAQHPETEAGNGDSMTKGHLQKVEREVLKLVETIKKQAETIEQLERKLANEDKILSGTGRLTQAGRDFFNAFREMYTTSVMSQLELRTQHLEREFSEMKTRTCENGVVLENYVKLHQSHKLMETEAKMKEAMTQFAMLTQHNTALLNLLSSVFASECPCKGSGSLFTQENTLTSTSGPQPANQSITAHLDAPADDNEDFNKALTKSSLSPQSELHQKKEKCLESAKEKTLRKKCFKPTTTSTVCENGEHSFFEVSNTRQFEKNIPIDEPQHEIIRKDKETLNNIQGNHNTLVISPWEFRCTDLESEHSEERTHHAFCKAEPEQYKDPCLERVAMTRSPSQAQLRSKDRQDGPMRRNFNEREAYSSTSNAGMMSSGPEFGSGQLYNSLGYNRNFLQREPLMTTSRPQTFENSLSFPNRVREDNQQTSYDKVGHHNASRVKPQKATLSTLQSKHPEVTHQALRKAEPKCYEEPHPERIQMTRPLTYDQPKSKDRQDESMRRNFVKMEAYSSVLNTYTTTSPAPGFGSGQCCNSLEHSGSFTPPISRPWRFVESVDSYLCRTWQQLYYHY